MKKLILPIVVMLCPMLLLATSATTTIAPAPHHVDVSENRPDDNDREVVVIRLKKVGYSEEEATARVDKMTDDEIVYFADHPESIKRSGFIIIASLIGSSVYTTIRNNQKRREAYIGHLRHSVDSFRSEIVMLEGKRTTETVLLSQEQDPVKKAEREATIEALGKEIQSKLDLINSLERETEAIRTKEQKVPKDFDAKKRKVTVE